MRLHIEPLTKRRPRRFLALLAAALILGSVLPGVGPQASQAAGPAGGKCREKLLGKTAPAKKDCVVLKPGAVDTTASTLPAGFTESIVFQWSREPDEPRVRCRRTESSVAGEERCDQGIWQPRRHFTSVASRC